LGLFLPRLLARAQEAVDDHLHRIVEGELLPPRAVRAAVLDLVLAQRALDVVLRRRALGAEAAACDRTRRVTFDLRLLAVLDVDELRAADRAVGTDRADDLVGLVDPRSERLRARRLDGLAETQRISLAQLAQERPRLDELRQPHCGPIYQTPAF